MMSNSSQIKAPSENPPHIAEHPVTILAAVRSLVGEVGLIAFDPLIGIFLGEMPVHLRQLADEVRCSEALVAFGVFLYSGHKSGANFIWTGHDKHFDYCFYIQYS